MNIKNPAASNSYLQFALDEKNQYIKSVMLSDVRLSRIGHSEEAKDMVTVQDVKERWEKIQNDDERILFIVGGPGSGKSLLIRELSEQKGWKYLEAKQLIEEEFLLVPRDERPQLAEEVIRRA